MPGFLWELSGNALILLVPLAAKAKTVVQTVTVDF
jgi:hypothetical protein